MCSLCAGAHQVATNELGPGGVETPPSIVGFLERKEFPRPVFEDAVLHGIELSIVTVRVWGRKSDRSSS